MTMWRTLRSKLTLLTITVAVVVLFLATLLTVISSTRALENQARTYAELLAQQVVLNAQIRWQAASREAFIKEVPSFTKGNEDRATVQVFLFDKPENVTLSSHPTPAILPLTADEHYLISQGRQLTREQTVENAQWMQVLTPLLDDDGQVVGAVRVLTNMQAVQELQKEEEYLSTILAVAFAAGLFVLLRIFFNHHVNQPLAQLINAMNTAEVGNLQIRVDLARADELGQLGVHFNRMLMRLEASDSENRRLNSRLLRFNEELEARVVAITRDLVEHNQELLRLQREMARVEPLAALGRVTGTIAHELGTPLNSVLGYCHLLAQEALPEGVRESIQIIETQTQRMTDIIRYYLSRTRDTVHQYQRLNINSLVQETVSLLKPVFQHNHVSVQTHLAAALPILKGESPSLQRVLINVLNNAVDAIEGEGNISVSTRLIAASATAQPKVIIEVSDTGKGISPELLPQIFDLFMTTKASGEGTGLGLAISQEIIKSHGGTISVTSQLGAGTCVQVVLPAAEEQNAATQLGSGI